MTIGNITIRIAVCILLAVFCTQGCATERLINKIPLASFDKFSYHRAGNVTSADVQATGASFDGKVMTINSLDIQEDWGPAVSLSISIEGYRREVTKDVELPKQ